MSSLEKKTVESNRNQIYASLNQQITDKDTGHERHIMEIRHSILTNNPNIIPSRDVQKQPPTTYA